VTRPRPRRKRVLLLVLVVGAATLLGILAFDRLPSTLGDNAEFAILGRSLAAGEGFRSINRPDARPSTKYPPGFPLMLAGWMKLFGTTVYALKVEVLVCYIAAMGMTLLLARRFLDDAFALIATGLVVLSWTVLNYSHQMLSDVPFLLSSLAALYLLDRGETRRTSLYAGMALCVWAYFVRTAGISLVIAAFVYLLYRARRKQAFILIGGFAVAAALWGIRNYLAAGEGSRYLGVMLAADPYEPELGMIGFSGLLVRMWINFSSYVAYLLPANLLPTIITLAGGAGGGAPRALISVVIMGVGFFGAYVLRKRALLVNLYLVLYFAIYLIWPDIWRSDRFMMPIAPLVAICFFAGFKRLLEYFELRRSLIAAVAVVLMLTNIFSLVTYLRRERGYVPGWFEYLQTALWVRENTPEDSIIICRKPFLYYLFSDRRSVSYPFTSDAAAMRKYLMEISPNYIVIDDFGGFTTTHQYLLPVLTQMASSLEVVYSTGEPVNTVLKFHPGRPVVDQ
jgi:hypothetical protein